MAYKPITDAERQTVADLHAAGRCRNDIAREIGRSGAAVSKIATSLGLSFNRAKVNAATVAKQADNRARRAALESDLLDDAQRLRQQVWESHRYWDWGGKDHDFGEITVDQPTPTDKLKLMQAAGTAIDRSLKIADAGKDTGDDAARSLLANFGAALGITPPETFDAG